MQAVNSGIQQCNRGTTTIKTLLMPILETPYMKCCMGYAIRTELSMCEIGIVTGEYLQLCMCKQCQGPLINRMVGKQKMKPQLRDPAYIYSILHICGDL